MAFSSERVAVQVVSTEVKALVNNYITEVLAEGKFVYRDAFIELLSEFPIPDRSLSDPNLYVDLFTNRIENYPFIEETDKGMRIDGPTVDLFDWNGMTPIQLAVVGLSGIYYELPEDIFESLSDRQLISKEVADELVDLFMYTEEAIGKNFFLIGETFANSLNTHLPDESKLVVFPFSDSSGVDIFSEGASRLRELLNSEKVASYLKSKLQRYSA